MVSLTFVASKEVLKLLRLGRTVLGCLVMAEGDKQLNVDSIIQRLLEGRLPTQ